MFQICQFIGDFIKNKRGENEIRIKKEEEKEQIKFRSIDEIYKKINFTKSKIILAKSKIILAKSKIILAKSKIILAKSKNFELFCPNGKPCEISEKVKNEVKEIQEEIQSFQEEIQSLENKIEIYNIVKKEIKNKEQIEFCSIIELSHLGFEQKRNLYVECNYIDKEIYYAEYEIILAKSKNFELFCPNGKPCEISEKVKNEAKEIQEEIQSFQKEIQYLENKIEIYNIVKEEIRNEMKLHRSKFPNFSSTKEYNFPTTEPERKKIKIKQLERLNQSLFDKTREKLLEKYKKDINKMIEDKSEPLSFIQKNNLSKIKKNKGKSI